MAVAEVTILDVADVPLKEMFEQKNQWKN